MRMERQLLVFAAAFFPGSCTGCIQASNTFFWKPYISSLQDSPPQAEAGQPLVSDWRLALSKDGVAGAGVSYAAPFIRSLTRSVITSLKMSVPLTQKTGRNQPHAEPEKRLKHAWGLPGDGLSQRPPSAKPGKLT